MSGRRILVALCVAIALTVVTVPALAGDDRGTETIFGMDPLYIDFENTGTDEMKVFWDIRVTDGVPVNVVLLDEENRDLYPGLAYEAYKGHQYTYVNRSKETVMVEKGKYSLAIESAHSSMDSSTVDYKVEWGEDAGLFDSPWCWPAAIILALLLAIFGALTGRQRASRTAMTKTPTPMDAPATGTGEMTELGPQPEPPDHPVDAGDEAPAPGTGVVQTPPEGATQLGPQPEPPDHPVDAGDEAPAPGTGVVQTPPEGATQLSPQPEPPDTPPADAWEEPVPDPLSPHAETVHAPDMPQVDASPQAEPSSPPEVDGRPPTPEEGGEVLKPPRPPGDG